MSTIASSSGSVARPMRPTLTRSPSIARDLNRLGRSADANYSLYTTYSQHPVPTAQAQCYPYHQLHDRRQCAPSHSAAGYADTSSAASSSSSSSSSSEGAERPVYHRSTSFSSNSSRSTASSPATTPRTQHRKIFTLSSCDPASALADEDEDGNGNGGDDDALDLPPLHYPTSSTSPTLPLGLQFTPMPKRRNHLVLVRANDESDADDSDAADEGEAGIGYFGMNRSSRQPVLGARGIRRR